MQKLIYLVGEISHMNWAKIYFKNLIKNRKFLLVILFLIILIINSTWADPDPPPDSIPSPDPDPA